jgi:hypothetical protein
VLPSDAGGGRGWSAAAQSCSSVHQFIQEKILFQKEKSSKKKSQIFYVVVSRYIN